MKTFIILLISLLSFSQIGLSSFNEPKIIEFPSGDLTLGGELFLPKGKGPFPVVLFNHGSAPKMLNSQASAIIAPMFTEKGWAFFMPYRRGQGLSENQGPYIMDEIRLAKKLSLENASKTMVKLLETNHFDDQMASLNWLKKQTFIQKDRIATIGNSFGGIQVVLGMAQGSYCAGIDASGGADSWAISPELKELLIKKVKESQNPIFFFQAENDYDLSPSETLSSEMTKVGKIQQLKIYPKFGKTEQEGHSFPYKGASIWFDDAYSFLNKYCPDTSN